MSVLQKGRKRLVFLRYDEENYNGHKTIKRKLGQMLILNLSSKIPELHTMLRPRVRDEKYCTSFQENRKFPVTPCACVHRSTHTVTQ